MPKFVLVSTRVKYDALTKTNDRIYFVKDTNELITNGLCFGSGSIKWGEIANASISLTIRDTTKSLSLSSHNHDSIYVPKNESYLPYVDKRNVNYTPYSTEFKWKGFSAPQLKQNGVDSLTDGGTYHSSIFIYPWGDSSGGAAHNIAFTDNGNLWMRHGTTSWSGWSKIWHSTNSNSTSVAWSAQQLILPTSGRLHANGQSFYIGNSNNGGWIGMQDMCSATTLGDSIWSIRISGAAIFKTVQANTYNGLGIHSGRNNESNKIVRTDGSGYIQAGWINTTSGSTGASGINKIYASNDDYIRWVTPADFRATIVGTGQWNFMTKSPGCYQDITVTGDANTYYPVVILMSNSENSIHNIVTISKWLGTATPSWSGNHSNGTSSGLYRYVYRYMGWDGNGGYIRTLNAWYGYAPFVAETSYADNASGALVIYLRGGGAWYRVSSNNPLSVKIYYTRTNIYNDTYPTWVEPRTSIGNAGVYNNSQIPCEVRNADMLDNVHLNGIFTGLSNSGTSLSMTVGTVTKTLTVAYASSSGNSDTVDNQHFSYSNTSNAPTYLWGTNSSGTNFLAKRDQLSVNYANYSGYGNKLNSGVCSNLNSPDWEEYRLTHQQFSISASNRPSVNDNANSVLNIPHSKHGTSGMYGWQMAFSSNSNIYIRRWQAGSIIDGWWNIWHSGNFDPGSKANSSHDHNRLLSLDNRNLTPSSAGLNDGIKAVCTYFYQVSNVISGYGSYADLLYLDTYSDSSGGNPNGLAFCKNANRIIHLYGAYKGGWNTAKPLAYKEEVDSVSSSIGDIGSLIDKINGTVV